MRKFLGAILLVAVCAMPLFGAVINNGHMWFWADETGSPLMDATVDAAPGDTVKVWLITNTNRAGWPGTYGWRAELWWDVGVIANPGSGDGSAYVTPFYEDPLFTLNAVHGSEVTLPPGGNYDATPDFNPPDYNHYIAVDLWGSAMWMYENMPALGFAIPIRPDAPLGLTVLGGRWSDLWRGENLGTIDAPDDWALKINVGSLIPEPATLSLLGLSSLALIRRRRKANP